ncbi:MAG: hypothetical protein EA366_04155 [Spirulina sp. DLM2.Bin59]|nr:MAG: hypothetical protein EA366_04155 [Spirulina sp. DLM2.Bin59]
MLILVCPGYNPPGGTRAFCTQLGDLFGPQGVELRPVPVPEIAPYDGRAIATLLTDLTRPVTLIGFSAGVVGAIAAARIWERQGGMITRLVAIDGWGVPLGGNFPIHRLSHDPFTHWSSALLGAGDMAFYADPGVEHWQLWQAPATAWGWSTVGMVRQDYTTALGFLHEVLH